MIGRFSLAVVVSVASFAAVFGALSVYAADRPGAAGFASANAPYAFVFPRDHGAHPAYKSEWWYYTGHLRAKDGRRFGYELTVFRAGLAPGEGAVGPGQSRWRGHQVYPAHFALTDEAGKRFFHVERFARAALGQGSASEDGLDLHVADWSISGSALANRALERMALHAAEGSGRERTAIDLVQIPLKPPAIHGHDGVSRKAACATCASHYYSYTRLKTSGTLTYGGERLAVEGLSWMDHEFGSDELQRDQVGWDWFSIQLDDGRELMLYLLRRKDGGVTPESSGSVIERDGRVRYVPLEAFTAEPTGTWTSPHTNGRYPSGWRVRLPGERIDLVLVPTLLDQELAGTNAGGISYWEGAVDVRDGADPQRTVGVGYVELTGYAGAISL
jgi:predicted secreted hydrolase